MGIFLLVNVLQSVFNLCVRQSFGTQCISYFLPSPLCKTHFVVNESVAVARIVEVSVIVKAGNNLSAKCIVSTPQIQFLLHVPYAPLRLRAIPFGFIANGFFCIFPIIHCLLLLPFFLFRSSLCVLSRPHSLPASSSRRRLVPSVRLSRSR